MYPSWVTRTALVGGLVVVSVLVWAYWHAIVDSSAVASIDWTLSGRTKVWSSTLHAIGERPTLGYGFGTFSESMNDNFFQRYRPPSAHESLLQAWFETGVPGMVLIAAAAVALVVQGFRYSVTMNRISPTLFLSVFVLLCSSVDVLYAGKISLMLALLLLVASQENHEVRTARQRIAGARAFSNA